MKLWPAPRAARRARVSAASHLALPAQLAEKLLVLKLAPLVRDNPRHLYGLLTATRAPSLVRKTKKKKGEKKVPPERAAVPLLPAVSHSSSASVWFFFLFGWVSLPPVARSLRSLSCRPPCLRGLPLLAGCCALGAASGSKWFSLSDPLRSMRFTLTVWPPLPPPSLLLSLYNLK